MGLKNATLQLAYLSGTVFQIKLMSWDNPVQTLLKLGLFSAITKILIPILTNPMRISLFLIGFVIIVYVDVAYDFYNIFQKNLKS